MLKIKMLNRNISYRILGILDFIPLHKGVENKSAIIKYNKKFLK